MKNFATNLAVLAVMGVMMAASPALAAPNAGKLDCSDQANAANPACAHPRGAPGQGPGRHDNNNAPGAGGQGAPQNDNRPHKGPGAQQELVPVVPKPQVAPGQGRPPRNVPEKAPGMGAPGMGGPGMGAGPEHGGNWSGRDRSEFHNRFQHYHFGPFARPGFPIRPGYAVPRSYRLRPLPPELFVFYPFFRGFLFFETPNGSIVIVDPNTYEIVAII